MRWIAALLVALVSLAPARAAPFFMCPSFTSGWTVSGTGPITAVMYDGDSQLLYVIFNSTFASAYSNAPISVIQTFSRSTNLVNTYNTLVVPNYSALLLEEQYNCAVLNETGAYIWTD